MAGLRHRDGFAIAIMAPLPASRCRRHLSPWSLTMRWDRACRSRP